MPETIEVIRGLGLGGAETLLYERLKAAIRLGLVVPSEVTVINTAARLGYYGEFIQKLGVRVQTLLDSDAVRGGVELVAHVRQAYSSDAIVIIHSPAPALALKAARAARVIDNPLLEVAHSTQYRRAYVGLGRMLNRFADVCLPVSRDVADANTTIGFPNKRVVHGGVDRDRMRRWVQAQGVSGARVLRDELGDSSGGLIVAVGNPTKAKGHSTLVRALPQILARHPRALVVIVGEGPERLALSNLAVALGVGDRVRLLGRIPDAWRYLAVADVQCHPSLFEGLPVVLMEGACLGVPQVVSRVGGTVDFIGHSGSAVGVSPGDVQLLAGAVSESLDRAQPLDGVFDQRGLSPSYWEVDRAAGEMAEVMSLLDGGRH